MAITITVWTSTYAPWEDGADDRERLSAESENLSFDNARECADYLEREGLQVPSSDAPYTHSWMDNVDPYEHPYTGILEERSAHSNGIHPRVWAAIVSEVAWH